MFNPGLDGYYALVTMAMKKNTMNDDRAEIK
jgi:hypothetical protein